MSEATPSPPPTPRGYESPPVTPEKGGGAVGYVSPPVTPEKGGGATIEFGETVRDGREEGEGGLRERGVAEVKEAARESILEVQQARREELSFQKGGARVSTELVRLRSAAPPTPTHIPPIPLPPATQHKLEEDKEAIRYQARALERKARMAGEELESFFKGGRSAWSGVEEGGVVELIAKPHVAPKQAKVAEELLRCITKAAVLRECLHQSGKAIEHIAEVESVAGTLSEGCEDTSILPKPVASAVLVVRRLMVLIACREAWRRQKEEGRRRKREEKMVMGELTSGEEHRLRLKKLTRRKGKVTPDGRYVAPSTPPSAKESGLGSEERIAQFFLSSTLSWALARAAIQPDWRVESSFSSPILPWTFQFSEPGSGVEKGGGEGEEKGGGGGGGDGGGGVGFVVDIVPDLSCLGEQGLGALRDALKFAKGIPSLSLARLHLLERLWREAEPENHILVRTMAIEHCNRGEVAQARAAIEFYRHSSPELMLSPKQHVAWTVAPSLTPPPPLPDPPGVDESHILLRGVPRVVPATHTSPSSSSSSSFSSPTSPSLHSPIRPPPTHPSPSSPPPPHPPSHPSPVITSPIVHYHPRPGVPSPGAMSHWPSEPGASPEWPGVVEKRDPRRDPRIGAFEDEMDVIAAGKTEARLGLTNPISDWEAALPGLPFDHGQRDLALVRAHEPSGRPRDIINDAKRLLE